MEPFPFTVDHLTSGRIELRRPSASEAETMQIPPDRWERFWDEIDKIGVWKWKAKYARKNSAGISWELDLTHEGRGVKAHGRDAYPECEGSEGEAHYPPGGQFDRFIQAIARLVGIPVDQIGSEPSDYD